MFTGPGQSLNGTFGRAVLESVLKVNELSESETVALSCTKIQNCSQNVFQTRMSPLNVGTSRFGSLTPFVSDDGDEADTRAWSSFFMFSEQSKMAFSTVASTSSSSLRSSESKEVRTSLSYF